MSAEKHDGRPKMITTDSNEENSPPKLTAAASSSFTAAPWLRLKDPRIVRVSRAFGGKDRHSKVCTIRGLRDRRVRLSVPTAIQLYDLQDRLGLNQPSKVVDWLLDAAKDDIDELPPLPIPSESLGFNYQSMLVPHTQTHPHRWEFKINCNSPGKEAEEDANAGLEQKQHRSSNSNPSHASSFSALLNNVGNPSFGYQQWEPSSTNYLPSFTSQAEEINLHNFNDVNLCLPSPLSLSTGSHFLDFNHMNQNFLVNSNSPSHPLYSINQSAVRPFHFSMAPKFISTGKNMINGDPQNKDNGFGSDK